MLDAPDFLALALDPALLFDAAGLAADPWQQQLLRSAAPRVLLNCSRQAGKSTTVAALALHRALFFPKSLVLLLSRAQRQASELFRKVLDFYGALARPVLPTSVSVLKVELANGSRIVALPGKEANIRSYSGVDLLIIDEAARVPDDLYRSVRPMLAVSGGRIILLSTPFGQRGFFHATWTDTGEDWLRVHVTAEQCPRVSSAFLEAERRTLGETWYRQEYLADFTALEGVVYPDFAAACGKDFYEPCLHDHRKVGGIDWGWANPFCALWGVLDTRSDVLHIQHEVYQTHAPLHALCQKLPRDVTWYADPAGAREIEELRSAGYVVRPADNGLRAGIAAVTARLQTQRLKVIRHACPNLFYEAGLYRYPRPDEAAQTTEIPVDEHNHALAALRYLVSRLDRKFMVRFRQGPQAAAAAPERADEAAVAAGHGRRLLGHERPWLDLQNPELWSPLN